MKTREMRYIVTIAQEGNISRAAKVLFITQPALSRTIAAVEKELGAPIFEHHGRRIIPTPIGALYIKHAEQILDMESKMRNQLRDMIQKKIDQVQIAVPMMYAGIISDKVFPEFNRKHPFIPLNICICGSADICQRMMNSTYRLGLAVLRDDMPDMFSYNIVGQVEMVVAVSETHPLLKEALHREGRRYPCVTIDQLMRYSFAVSEPKNRSYMFAQDYFAHHGITPNIICQVPYTGYLYNVAANGNCIALVPDIPMKPNTEKKSVQYLCLDDICHLDTLAVIHCQDHRLTAYETELIDTIRKHFRFGSAPKQKSG